MLIKTSTASTPQWQDPDVRRASAYEPELADDGAPGAAAAKLAPAQPSYAPQQPAGSDPAAAAGFAEADAEPTRVRRPVIEVLRNREHSILRRPLSRFRGERR